MKNSCESFAAAVDVNSGLSKWLEPRNDVEDNRNRANRHMGWGKEARSQSQSETLKGTRMIGTVLTSLPPKFRPRVRSGPSAAFTSYAPSGLLHPTKPVGTSYAASTPRTPMLMEQQQSQQPAQTPSIKPVAWPAIDSGTYNGRYSIRGGGRVLSAGNADPYQNNQQNQQWVSNTEWDNSPRVQGNGRAVFPSKTTGADMHKGTKHMRPRVTSGPSSISSESLLHLRRESFDSCYSVPECSPVAEDCTNGSPPRPMQRARLDSCSPTRPPSQGARWNGIKEGKKFNGTTQSKTIRTRVGSGPERESNSSKVEGERVRLFSAPWKSAASHPYSLFQDEKDDLQEEMIVNRNRFGSNSSSCGSVSSAAGAFDSQSKEAVFTASPFSSSIRALLQNAQLGKGRDRQNPQVRNAPACNEQDELVSGWGIDPSSLKSHDAQRGQANEEMHDPAGRQSRQIPKNEAVGDDNDSSDKFKPGCKPYMFRTQARLLVALLLKGAVLGAAIGLAFAAAVDYSFPSAETVRASPSCSMSSQLPSLQNPLQAPFDSLKERRESTCATAMVHDQVMFVGPRSATAPANVNSLEACCSRCSKESDCIAITFFLMEQACMLHFEAIYQTVGKAWARSMTFHASLPRTIGLSIEQLAEKPAPVRETSWWDAYKTQELSTNGLTFLLSATYHDSVTGRLKKRADYTNFVRPALEKLGFKPKVSSALLERGERQRVTDNFVNHALATAASRAGQSSNPSFVWGLHYKSLEDFERAGLEPWQQVNMLPGAATLVLGDKDALHRTTRSWPGSEHNKFMPSSYMFPDELANFQHEQLSGAGKRSVLWVWKELGTWSGDGVRVLSAENVLQEAATRFVLSPDDEQSGRQVKETRVVLQKYVSNPLTLNGHKFDTRWWAVITSVKPLRVFAMPDAYVRVAQESRYSTAASSLDDKCIHITNGKVQKKCAAERGGPQSKRWPSLLRDLDLEQQVTDSHGHHLQRAQRVRFTSLVSRTHAAIVKTIALGLPKLRTLRGHTRARAFQLLAFDIAYDDASLDPWILEVNTNGFLGGGIQQVASDNAAVLSMLSMVGAAGYKRDEYQAKLEREIRAMDMKNKRSKTGKLGTESKAAMQNAIDELFHRGKWQMVFPIAHEATAEEEAELKSMMVKAGMEKSEFDDANTLKGLLEAFPGLV